jgi:uncharacterized membrane protein
MNLLDRIDNDVRTSYSFSQIVFNYIKNTLAIGGVYYVLNRYDKSLAEITCWILFTFLISPVLSIFTTSMLLLVHRSIGNIRLIFINAILSMFILSVFYHYFNGYVSAIAAFIASKS